MFQKAGLLFVAAVLFAVGCQKENVTNLEVNMINSAGDSIGTVKLTEQAKGVKLKLDLEGLPPGEHAIHIHEKGVCTKPDFQSAGNHYNPDGKNMDCFIQKERMLATCLILS